MVSVAREALVQSPETNNALVKVELPYTCKPNPAYLRGVTKVSSGSPRRKSSSYKERRQKSAKRRTACDSTTSI